MDAVLTTQHLVEVFHGGQDLGNCIVQLWHKRQAHLLKQLGNGALVGATTEDLVEVQRCTSTLCCASRRTTRRGTSDTPQTQRAAVTVGPAPISICSLHAAAETRISGPAAAGGGGDAGAAHPLSPSPLVPILCSKPHVARPFWRGTAVPLPLLPSSAQVHARRLAWLASDLGKACLHSLTGI